MPSSSPVLNPLDPALLPALNKQYVAFYNKHLADTPMIHQVPWNPAIRKLPSVAGGAAALSVARTKDIALDRFSIRIFYPSTEASLPVFIWYHGGGMVLGSLDAENAFCTRIAITARCAVVAVDYRLAPEHKFPAGHDDAWTAFKYVVDNGAGLGLDVSRLGVGGSSSGANLAAMVSHCAGLEGAPINFVVLGVPVVDNTATPETYKSWDQNRNCPGLNDAKMLWYRDQYLPNTADRSDPIASPFLAPDEWVAASANSVYIALAGLDLLRSEGEAYAKRLRDAGKDVEVHEYSDVPHLVQAMDGVLDVARQWIKDMCTYVAVRFGAHPADVTMAALYPNGVEVGVPRIEGGQPWVRLPGAMVLGEAPLYRASDKTLHYVDCLADPAELHILRLNAAGDPVGPLRESLRVIELEDSVTVACFRESKPGYICAYFQGVAFMDEDGNLEVLKEIIPTSDRGVRRFNDGGVDCMGRFWLAEIDRAALAMGPGRLPDDYGEPLGRLWRYDPDGSLHLMEQGLVCGNGLAWSPDNETMYLNDSAAGLVWAYDFDIPSGSISNKRLFIDRRQLGGEPDGMVCDVNGDLWIAMWGTSCVMCYGPDGNHVKDIRFSAKNMACTAWGGLNNDTLYIASATDKAGTPGDDGGHLFKYHVGVQGLPKFEFKG